MNEETAKVAVAPHLAAASVEQFTMSLADDVLFAIHDALLNRQQFSGLFDHESGAYQLTIMRPPAVPVPEEEVAQ